MRSAATLLGLFVLGSLAFTACDGDDDTVSGTGGGSGSGGSAAKGGSAGTGGSKPEGGESGTANGSSGKGGNNGVGGTSSGRGGTSSGKGGTSSGKGGTGANGGSGTGGGAGEGAAGASAAAGDNGTGGTTGGTGGTGGSIGASGAGAGGDAGNNGGEAGSGEPAPSPKACTYQCTADEDCDPAHEITCVDGLCLNAGLACNTHEECIAWASTFLPAEPCAQDSDCDGNELYGDLCMNVGGTGLCLNIPVGADCVFGGQPTLGTKFGTIDTATVCLEPAGRCDARQCFVGCASDPDCAGASGSSKRGPHCNTDTGKCGGCTGDGDCGGAGTSHCNVSTGVCGCQVDNDCAGLAGSGLDSCVAGKCSCSASSCSTYPNATPICG